jgi:hypothetical protein
MDMPTPLWWLAYAVLLVLIGYLVWIPIRTARERNHPQRDAITVCAVLGLFLWPLWLVALIWSLTVPAGPKRSRPSKPPKRPAGYTGSQVLDMPKNYVPPQDRERL